MKGKGKKKDDEHDGKVKSGMRSKFSGTDKKKKPEKKEEGGKAAKKKLKKADDDEEEGRLKKRCEKAEMEEEAEENIRF